LKRLIWPITCILRRSLTSTKHPTLHSAKHPSVSSERSTTDRHKSLTPGPKTQPQGQTPPASPFLNHNLSKSASVPRGLRRQQIALACAQTNPCSTGGTVIPDQPIGGPPQRWRASKARRSSCQPRLRTAEAFHPQSRLQKTNSRPPGYPAGQSRCLSEDASAPGPLPRPAPMNRGIRTRLGGVNTHFADCRSQPSRRTEPLFPMTPSRGVPRASISTCCVVRWLRRSRTPFPDPAEPSCGSSDPARRAVRHCLLRACE